MKNNLIEAKNIIRRFETGGGFFSLSKHSVAAVDNVSISVQKGEVHGIVGESGCGKTTLAKIILGLDNPTQGEVIFENKKISEMSRAELRKMRRKIQVVFQDPYSSLDPRMTVEETVAEPLIIHSLYPGKNERRQKVISLLESVGLSKEYLNRYPHEFSGGQRQRIGVARALALAPKLIVADEPVSALDVSIQAQILNLLKDLQSQYQLSYLFISHDFLVMRFLCGRISVMYLGRIVESAPADEIMSNPQHPYTEALLSAVPVPDPQIQHSRKTVLLAESSGSKEELLARGCRFRNRCRYAITDCETTDPPLDETAQNHYCACLILPFKNKPSAAAIAK